MPSPSIYQKFLRSAWARIRHDYPFVTRFRESFCVAIPKSSSFLLGRSPKNGKFIVLNFQHHPKAWGTGQFTVNVHISTELVPTKRLAATSGYQDAEDGYYRLAPECVGYDKWWCLIDRDRSEDDDMSEFDSAFDPTEADREFFENKWRPTAFDSEEVVIQQAVTDVLAMVDLGVVQRFGFPSAR